MTAGLGLERAEELVTLVPAGIDVVVSGLPWIVMPDERPARADRGRPRVDAQRHLVGHLIEPRCLRARRSVRRGAHGINVSEFPMALRASGEHNDDE
jgi:hypothetical protein